MIILTINSGSTSIKFKLYEMPQETVIAEGKISQIGQKDPSITIRSATFNQTGTDPLIKDHRSGIDLLIKKLSAPGSGIISSIGEIEGIGHRLINIGDKVSSSSIVDERIISFIEDSLDLAPLHNPPSLAGLKICRDIFGQKPNVGVFDNLFHKDMPRQAYLYGLPYEYYEKYRIRKYGFHGIAYTSMMDRLKGALDVTGSRIIAMMLGGGSSITAIKNCTSIDTSMGFTPAEGLIMSTRCGDIDPAIMVYLIKKEGLSYQGLDEVINMRSGVFGLSGKYRDHKDIESGYYKKDISCIRALDAYAYRIKKYIGSYLAVLNGADALVFGGGIGENSHLTRRLVLSGLDHFGICLDKTKNEGLTKKELQEKKVIEVSKAGSSIKVFVVDVDEEVVIAREAYLLIKDVT
jgi:acetate kinase